MKAKFNRIILLAAFLGVISSRAAMHYVDAASPNAIPPYTNWATAATIIQDAVDAAAPGDTVLVTNGVYATGGRAVYGTMTNRVAMDKPIRVESLMGPEVTVIQGAKAPGGGNGDGAVRCVHLAGGACLSGFTLTGGATRNVGVDEREASGGGLWCETNNAAVSNCVLTGNSAAEAGGGALRGTLNNCTLSDNSAAYGGGAAWGTLNNCTLSGNWAYAGGGAAGATLNNCTLTDNRVNGNGGGADGSTLNNCTVEHSYATHGGGAYNGTLNNCTLSGNTAETGGGADGGWLVNCRLVGNHAWDGGGAYASTLVNCTLTDNSSYFGAAAEFATLNNCIAYGNTATAEPNHYLSTLNFCCTTPAPTNGTGNITNEPGFVDFANGNLRLQSNSPCINAGNNAYAPSLTDLDGRPRIVGGTVDMGAYEFQGPGIGEFIGWLAQFSRPTDGSTDFTDPDGDRFNNWQEYRCGTDPTNALSVLRLLPPAPAGADVTVVWQSVTNRSYVLEWSTNLAATPTFLPLATNLPGQPSTTSFTHTNGAGAGPRFYRVGVP